MAFSVSKQLT